MLRTGDRTAGSGTGRGEVSMKIGEAQEIYREQVRAYRVQRAAVAKQLEGIRGRIKISLEDEERYGAEAATLELTLKALDEKQQEYQDYLSRLAERYCAYWNAEAAEGQADAAEERAADMAKVMEVARRIMRGDIVPAYDEKKLMEFSADMYQTAKSIGAMVRRQKREKYDSLWEDEEEKEYGDPREAAENGEAAPGAPEIVDAAETVASVQGEG